MDDQYKNLVLPWVGRIERQFSILMREALAEHDLTYPEFRLIGMLWGEDEGYSQKHLAARLGQDASGISVILKRLEKKGMVERIRAPEDARVYRVKCTPLVYQLETVTRALGTQEAIAVQGLKPDEISILTNMLEKVSLNLSEKTGVL